MTVDLPGLLLAALLCAEVAAAGLAVRAAAQKRSGPDLSEPLRHFQPRWIGYPYALLRGCVLGGAKTVRRVRAIVKSPLVVLLTFALADELACLALHAALDGAPRPLADWYRAGWHVSIALSLGWPAALAWACWRVIDDGAARTVLRGKIAWIPVIDGGKRGVSDGARSSKRALDPLLGAYLGTLAGLAIVYPPSRAGLRWTLLAWELACVAVAWWGLWRRRTVAWGAAEVCIVVLVACESAVVLVGPFASDPFLRWWIARAFYLGAWGACCGVLARGTMTRSS